MIVSSNNDNVGAWFGPRYRHAENAFMEETTRCTHPAYTDPDQDWEDAQQDLGATTEAYDVLAMDARQDHSPYFDSFGREEW